LKRGVDFFLRAVGIALAIALAVGSWQLARAQQVNRELAARLAGPVEPPQPLGQDPRLWVAALRRATRVSQEQAAPARAATGAMYLQAALKLESGADASGLSLFELAKESYRSATMGRPDLWDAKFNLELALRAAPDPDPDDAGAPPVLTGERAVTTMRAFTLGLP
jgi:mxaK protein